MNGFMIASNFVNGYQWESWLSGETPSKEAYGISSE